jgi:hypothetical protein
MYSPEADSVLEMQFYLTLRCAGRNYPEVEFLGLPDHPPFKQDLQSPVSAHPWPNDTTCSRLIIENMFSARKFLSRGHDICLIDYKQPS